MNIFNRLYSKKRSRPLQIGISENEQDRCLIWAENGKPQIHWQRKTAPLDLSQAVSFRKNFALICPVPCHYIWRKTLFLPLEPNKTLSHKQIIQILKNELPTTLDQINFDYLIQTVPEKQVQQLNLYALRKTYANTLLTQYPTILDCELHCYLRAIQTINPEHSQFITEMNELIFKSNLENNENSELSLQNIKEKVLQLPNIAIPDNALDKSLYLLALGASLWQ